jgi:gamma-glutamylaminecyclotransferase
LFNNFSYPLVIASRYNIPYLLDVPNCGMCVVGEIYSVDESKLRHLDVLEDYPKYYTRRVETIVRLDTNDDVQGRNLPNSRRLSLGRD